MNEDLMVFRGRAWVFGNDIPNDGGVMPIKMTRQAVYDTDILSRHCMTCIDSEFPTKVNSGDVIIAGKNFGRGQLHVQGPLGIRGLNMGVITESMPRTFFRIAMSVGMKMLPFVPGITDLFSTGDELEADFRSGSIKNLTSGGSQSVEPLPDFLIDIMAAGGEIAWLKLQTNSEL